MISDRFRKLNELIGFETSSDSYYPSSKDFVESKSAPITEAEIRARLAEDIKLASHCAVTERSIDIFEQALRY